jgi:hypothetical protein
MSQNFDWTLLSFQPFDCRPLESISVSSGPFAPDFAPGFAPDWVDDLCRNMQKCGAVNSACTSSMVATRFSEEDGKRSVGC